MAPRGNNGRLIRNDDGGPRPVIENSYNPGKDKGPTDNTAWLINNPDFDERPATMEEFLGPGYIDIDRNQNPNLPKGVGIRPGVKKALIDIFGTEIDPERISVARRAMATGGIGIGKSTMASIALSYMVHWVSCLHDPQSYFGLLPGSRIAFMLMSTKDSQAKEVLFGDIKSLVNNSDWFKKNALPNNGPGEKTIKNQLKFPRDIWLIPGNSSETTFEGYNILAGVIDEGDSHRTTEVKDYAEAGWNTISGRISSRFTDPLRGDHRGLLMAIGQMKKQDGFMAKKKAELEKDEKAVVVTMTIWESLGWDYYKNKNGVVDFFYFDKVRKVIVPPGPAQLVQSESIIKIPNTYLKDFENDPVKALRDLAGIPPAVEDPFIAAVDRIDDAQEKWAERFKDLKYTVDSSTSNPQFHPDFFSVDNLKRAIHVDVAYACVDIETEILTQRGWLKWNEVKPGDLTLGIDEKTHIAEWTEISNVSYYPSPGEMVSIEGKSHSSLTTKNHRWYVDQRKYVNENGFKGYSGYEPAVINSENLNGRHFIVSGSFVSNLPKEQKWNDEFVKLVAWFWTEGHLSRLRNGVAGDYGYITQSRVVNKKHCERIEATFRALFGEPVSEFIRSGRIKPTKPEWKIVNRGNGNNQYFFNSFIGKMLREVAPDRVVTSEFVASLTESQLLMFIQVSEWDDGNGVKSHGQLSQSNPKRLEALQMAWVLLGHRTNKTFSGNKYSVSADQVRDNVKIIPSNVSIVKYNGIVWCPTTGKGSWLARRNGKTYYTGNSHGDSLGMCMGHIPEIVEVDGELKPYIVIDFLLRIKPSGGQQLMLSDFRQIIYYVRDELKFNVSVVTLDGFQSVDSIQIMRQKRFNTAELSVDRKKGPYEDLRQAIYERRIEFPAYMVYANKGDTEKLNIVKKELMELTDVGLKIDHPPKGSKDVSDSLAGVVHVLMGNNAYRRGARRTYSNVPQMEEPDLSGISVARPQEIDIFSMRTNTPEKNPSDELLSKFALPPIEKNPFPDLRYGPQTG